MSGARVDDRKNNWNDEDREAVGGDDSFDVNIQPDVSALRMFRSMSFTPWYALGEFVDNSITSAMKNKDALVAVNGRDYRLRERITIDWDVRESVRAGIRATVKTLLAQRGYPPDYSDEAIEMVLKQTEVFAERWTQLGLATEPA